MAQTIKHLEDPEWDHIDVLERYIGRPLVSLGSDGFTEIFDDEGCDILDDDDSVSLLKHKS